MKKTEKNIQLKHLERVVDDLLDGKEKHGPAKKYDQTVWCGTKSCVLGHAYALVFGKTGLERNGRRLSDHFIQQKEWVRHKMSYRLYSLLQDHSSSLRDIKRQLVEDLRLEAIRATSKS